MFQVGIPIRRPSRFDELGTVVFELIRCHTFLIPSVNAPENHATEQAKEASDERRNRLACVLQEEVLLVLFSAG